MAKVINIVALARAMAIWAHSDQQYGIGKPYIYHLEKVAEVLRRFHVKSNVMQAAALLHDTLEDTKLTKDEISKQVGDEVANLVWTVTDEPGKNRAERHRKTLPKIAAAGTSAIVLKLADRIANVEEGLFYGPSTKLKMYVQEFPDFAVALQTPPSWKREPNYDKTDAMIFAKQEMWNYLGSICDPVQGLRGVLSDVLPHINDESRQGMVERALKAYL